VRLEDCEELILAEALIGKVIGERAHEVIETKTGAELEGTEYEPLFTYAEPEGGPAYRVVTAGFVSLASGSGLVHIAPAFGEDDFAVRKEKGLGFLQLVQP